MKDAIHAIIDEGYLFEVHEHFAKNIVVGFARLDGRPVGIVANHRVPGRRSHIDALSKVRVSFVSVTPLISRSSPLKMFQASARHRSRIRGIINHGAKLLFAYAEATVPKITVITRKAYGGAYCVMASKHIALTRISPGPPPRLRSWAQKALNIVYKRDPEKVPESSASSARKKSKNFATVSPTPSSPPKKATSTPSSSLPKLALASSPPSATSKTSATPTRAKSTATSLFEHFFFYIQAKKCLLTFAEERTRNMTIREANLQR